MRELSKLGLPCGMRIYPHVSDVPGPLPLSGPHPLYSGQGCTSAQFVSHTQSHSRTRPQAAARGPTRAHAAAHSCTQSHAAAALRTRPHAVASAPLSPFSKEGQKGKKIFLYFLSVSLSPRAARAARQRRAAVQSPALLWSCLPLYFCTFVLLYFCTLGPFSFQASFLI